MIKRHLKSILQLKLKQFPVVGVLGPRQVGKTTVVKDVLKATKKKAVYLDLELPSDLNLLRDPELYFRENIDQQLILDEIHHKPDLFPVMRSLIDIKRKPGRFFWLLARPLPRSFSMDQKHCQVELPFVNFIHFH